MPVKPLTPLEIAAIRRGAGGGNVTSIIGIGLVSRGVDPNTDG